jgi:hypothetical protein
MRAVCGRSLVSLLLLLGGCGLTLDIGPRARAAQDGAAHDAAKRDAGSIDGAVTEDGGPRLDATVAVDARLGRDSGALIGLCPSWISGRTLALYPLDGNLDNVAGGSAPSGGFTDRNGVLSAPTYAPFVPSSLDSACEEALHFTPVRDGQFTAVVIPPWDEEDYEIAEVSAWFKPTPASVIGSRAIVSRDSMGQTESGHLTIFMDEEQMRIAARIQTSLGNIVLCSESTVSYDVWHHVAVVLGDTPALLLDGVEQRGTGRMEIPGGKTAPMCQGSTRAPPMHMGATSDPWVIGACAWRSPAGTADVLEVPWSGYLDHIRIQGP